MALLASVSHARLIGATSASYGTRTEHDRHEPSCTQAGKSRRATPKPRAAGSKAARTVSYTVQENRKEKEKPLVTHASLFGQRERHATVLEYGTRCESKVI